MNHKGKDTHAYKARQGKLVSTLGMCLKFEIKYKVKLSVVTHAYYASSLGGWGREDDVWPHTLDNVAI